MPYIASVEIDQRQNFIQQSDTLREMVGASRMIGFSVDRARKTLPAFPKVHLFWPVSGVLRFYSTELANLGGFLLVYRRSLEQFSLTCSIGVRETTGNLDNDLTVVDIAVRSRKDANTSPVPIPSTPFFAPCSIMPHLPATIWEPDAKESDRRLRSWQAKEREDFRFAPVSPSTFHIPPRRLAKLEQLVSAQDSRSYIGLIKGDVDGLGDLLAKLKFEEIARDHPEIVKQAPPGLPPAAAAAQIFVAEFQDLLESAVADAYEKVPPDEKPADKPLPYRHLIVAGDDIFILARRDIALRLACDIEQSFSSAAAQNQIVNAALECAGVQGPLTITLGVLFAKYGYPFDASFDLAEDLLRSAKKDGRRGNPSPEGGIDFHWLGDSARPRLSTIRDTQFFYEGDLSDDKRMWLTTLPWTCTRAVSYLDGAAILRAAIPRRKLKQLDQITRMGREVSELAYRVWRKGLEKKEREILDNTLSDEGPVHWGDPDLLWRRRDDGSYETCFNDLVQLTEVIAR